jgi:hypothetical protein
MRRLVYLPFLGLLLICAAWSVLWKVTASNVEAGIDQWFADEQKAGRLWSCKDRDLGGYPFRIEFRCSAPSFTTAPGNVTASGSVGDILAVANVYQPSLIVAKAQAPLHFQTADLQVDVKWDDLEVSHRMKDGEFDNAASQVTRPVVTIAKSGSAVEVLRADRIEAYARPRQTGGGLEVALRAIQAKVPMADRVTGEDAPLDLIARASADSQGLLVPAPLPFRLEAWRRAGGGLDIAELKLGKGAALVEATGRFTLDDAHRPQGRLDLQASGVEPILQRLGVPTAAVAIGSVLSGLLPGAKPRAADAPQGQLKLPLTIANGRIAVGPARTPFTVLPLY